MVTSSFVIFVLYNVSVTGAKAPCAVTSSKSIRIPVMLRVGGHVKVDILEGVPLVFADFSLAQYAFIQDVKAAFVLDVDHVGQVRPSDHVILHTDVLRHKRRRHLWSGSRRCCH